MLTQEQIDFFHRNGYLIMRNVIKGAELEVLQRAADLVQTMGINRMGPNHLYAPFSADHKVYWRSEDMWNRGDIFEAVTVNPDLLENVGQCIGHAYYPVNDSFVVKLPYSGSRVKWHQDPPYNSNRQITFEIPNFTTDIYLDYSGPDNGCVYAIPGHHLIGHVDMANKSEQEMFEKYGAIPIQMRPGDVLFHCLSTPHGSDSNTSSRQRRIFYIHYMAREVYLDGYPNWTKWGPNMHQKTQKMIESRAKLGLSSPLDRPTIKLSEEGFEFTGSPCTPERYWGTLRENMSAEEKQLRKQLGKLDHSMMS